jgi:alkylation response protein AidB-like acyl-CoA dehydrogenase
VNVAAGSAKRRAVRRSVREPEEWKLIRAAVGKIIETEAPSAAVREWDATCTYPARLFEILAEQGFTAMPFRAENGGADAGPTEMVVVAEELGRRGMDIAAGFGISVFLGLMIEAHGTREQRNTLLPGILRAQQRLALSMTEPGAGSDAGAITTTARLEGDDYVISGQKVFTTGANLPNTTLVVSARDRSSSSTSRGISLFLVPTSAAGVAVSRLDTVGRHILGTNEVFLDDVRVPPTALIGPSGKGWGVLREGMTLERLFTCGAYIGGFETVIDMTLDYGRQREQFGRPIGEFQAISHPIADMYADLEAARLLTYSAARAVAQGEDARTLVSVAKLFVTESYQRATNHAMQVFGGYGYMNEFDVHRFWKDARIGTVSAGTSQIHREIICRALGLRP